MWGSGLIEPTRTLEPGGEKTGNLSVYSEPPGLDVSLDGEKIGKTPIQLKAVKAGYHVLRVRDVESEIYIRSGKNLRLSLYKGSLIEIHRDSKEARPPQKPDGVKDPKKSKSQPPNTRRENLHPNYWPLNPGGPIY